MGCLYRARVGLDDPLGYVVIPAFAVAAQPSSNFKTPEILQFEEVSWHDEAAQEQHPTAGTAQRVWELPQERFVQKTAPKHTQNPLYYLCLSPQSSSALSVLCLAALGADNISCKHQIPAGMFWISGNWWDVLLSILSWAVTATTPRGCWTQSLWTAPKLP